MRIAHITCVWPPYGGGVGVVAHEQAKLLAARGHQVTVFTPAYNGTKSRVEIEHNIKVVYLKPVFSLGNAAFLPQLLWLLRGFDLVHLHLYFVGSTKLVLLATYFRRIPLVVQYHNDLKGEGVRYFIFRLYTVLMLPAIVWLAKAVLGSSTSYINSSDLGKVLKYFKSKQFIVPNGVDTNHFSPGPVDNKLLEKYDIKPDDQVVLFVGGLDKAHYFKGLQHLLSAIAQIKEPRVKLLIVGEGDQKLSYQTLAEFLGITQRVVFVGLIKQTNLPSIYRLARVFVLPSYEVESFGVVLAEAMSCGVPVITTKLPGPCEVVGEAGLTVPVNDVKTLAEAITTILTDDKLKNDFVNQGRRRVVSNFDWQAVVDKLEIVYRNCIN